MTYIQLLRKQLARHELANKAMLDCLRDFDAHLNSDKFRGVQSDGSRKDWIATGDVLRWTNQVRETLWNVLEKD